MAEKQGETKDSSIHWLTPQGVAMAGAGTEESQEATSPKDEVPSASPRVSQCLAQGVPVPRPGCPSACLFVFFRFFLLGHSKSCMCGSSVLTLWSNSGSCFHGWPVFVCVYVEVRTSICMSRGYNFYFGFYTCCLVLFDKYRGRDRGDKIRWDLLATESLLTSLWPQRAGQAGGSRPELSAIPLCWWKNSLSWVISAIPQNAC